MFFSAEIEAARRVIPIETPMRTAAWSSVGSATHRSDSGSCAAGLGRPSDGLVFAFAVLLAVVAVLAGGCASSNGVERQRVVEAHVASLMAEHHIPGIAVAVVHHGRIECYCYGVASRETGEAVTPDTLFELGSVSKVFTGLVGAYGVARGAFSLDDPVSTHWDVLAGSAFDRATMGQLATYSAGGLPLQFPEGVTGEAGMIDYFRSWRPSFEPGATRVYSNPSIGLFGLVAAKAAGADFDELMTGTVLPGLGMRDTYINVPPSAMPRYAFGYNANNEPVRVAPGVLDHQAYGLKSTASDMGRFLRAQMQCPHDPLFAEAMTITRVGRYSVGPMTQGLGWEMYPNPVDVETLLKGNSTDISLQPNAVSPPRALGPDVLLNKTGSTGGFGAYVVVVPAEKIGVVLLANRNFPIAARVRAAHTILGSLRP